MKQQVCLVISHEDDNTGILTSVCEEFDSIEKAHKEAEQYHGLDYAIQDSDTGHVYYDSLKGV